MLYPDNIILLNKGTGIPHFVVLSLYLFMLSFLQSEGKPLHQQKKDYESLYCGGLKLNQ